MNPWSSSISSKTPTKVGASSTKSTPTKTAVAHLQRDYREFLSESLKERPSRPRTDAEKKDFFPERFGRLFEVRNCWVQLVKRRRRS